MTIKEKAKAYDEALKQIKECTPDENGFVTIYPNEIFPELKESEDEKIRKVLKQYFEDYKTQEKLGVSSFFGVPTDKILAWLEKQGESYTKRDVDDAYLKGVTDTKKEIEKQYEANYQIRKDIATFIFNYKGDIKDRAKWMDYLGINVSLVEKQGEQKPVEWSEEDEKTLNQCAAAIHAADYYDLDDKNEMENWLKSLKDRFLPQPKQEWSKEDESLRNDAIYYVSKYANNIARNESEIEKAVRCENWLKSISPQPKQEWNEKEMEMYNGALACVEYLKENYGFEYINVVTDINKIISWLKSLRPQKQWKPSEEQLLAVGVAINVIGKGTLNGQHLIELLEQLKAL